MLNTSEQITCTVLPQPDNYHFEGRCEDCDTHALAYLNRNQVEDRYHGGRISQDQFEACMYVWALLSPAGSSTGWRETPVDADVRRISRKLLTHRGFGVPAALVDEQPSEFLPAA